MSHPTHTFPPPGRNQLRSPGVSELTTLLSSSTATLVGNVMSLVAFAIGFLAVESILGRDISYGAALACSLVGFGMLLAQAFAGRRLRVGGVAIAWPFAIALLIGFGLGPDLGTASGSIVVAVDGSSSAWPAPEWAAAEAAAHRSRPIEIFQTSMGSDGRTVAQ